MRPVTCLAMGAEMEHTADEIKRLQACINDLISVLALPAIWSGYESSQIVSTLLDVLLGMLRLDFAYARLSDAFDGSPIEVIRLAQRPHLAAQPQEVGRALDRYLAGDPPSSPLVVPNPIGAGEVSIATCRLGPRHPRPLRHGGPGGHRRGAEVGEPVAGHRFGVCEQPPLPYEPVSGA